MATRDRGVNPILLVSAAALFDAENNVLLQRRPAGDDLAGLWELPGGKVEVEETPIEALIRELHEELDITVSARDVVPLSFVTHPLGERHLLLLLFSVTRWQGTAVARHATALKWCAPGTINPDQMPPADRPLVTVLKRWVEIRSA